MLRDKDSPVAVSDVTGSRPLLAHSAVKEFVSLMDANNSPDRVEVIALFRQIAEMEKLLGEAVKELSAMRKELAAVKESPHKASLKKVVNGMEQSVAHLRERLNDVKESILYGCKQSVAAFRAHGISALNHMADFFHLRPALEALNREANKAIDHNEKSIANLHKAGVHYHEAARSFRNVGRVLLGREPLKEAKSSGSLIRMIENSYKRQLVVFSNVKRLTTSLLNTLQRMEKSVQRPTSIRQTMKEFNDKRTQEQRETPSATVEHDDR